MPKAPFWLIFWLCKSTDQVKSYREKRGENANLSTCFKANKNSYKRLHFLSSPSSDNNKNESRLVYFFHYETREKASFIRFFLYEGLLPLPSSPFCATKLPFFSTMLYLIFIYIIFFIQIFQLVFRFQPVFVYSQNIVIYFARYHCYHSDFLASAGFVYTSLQSPRSPLVL